MARFTTGSDINQQDLLPLDVQAPRVPTGTNPVAVPGSGRPRSPQAGPVRTNLYGAKCNLCGVYVEAQEGLLENRGGRWVVTHIQPCPSTTQGPIPVVHDEDDTKPTERPKFLHDGFFTVSWDEHHKTIRVRTQDQFDTFMPGKIILGHLTGSNNDNDYTNFGHVDENGVVRIWKKHQSNPHLREAVKVLLGDPKAASQAYAIESNHCSMCNRTLTVPASIHAGVGPECAKKATW